jgi:hypothetical protein
MCAQGLFYLIPSFRFRLAEQFLEIEPAFRGAGRTSRFSCVADLPVKPEPEVYGGALSYVQHIALFDSLRFFTWFIPEEEALVYRSNSDFPIG